MKKIQIEAVCRTTGERGVIEVDCPENLAEFVSTYGEKDTFKSALATKVIEWQRDARPVASKNGADKPKKRLSVYDRLSQS